MLPRAVINRDTWGCTQVSMTDISICLTHALLELIYDTWAHEALIITLGGTDNKPCAGFDRQSLCIATA